MKTLYYKYLHIPKDGKIRESVMVARTALTVVVLLICLAGISLTAYAWFSCSVVSSTTTLIAADFDLDVSVTVTQGSSVKEPNTDGTYSLQEGSTYTVVLTKTGSASTGFCILETDFGGNKTFYHTQQLGQDGTQQRPFLQFDLKMTDSATVRFTPHWGTSTHYGYENADANPLYIKNGSTFTPSPVSAQGQQIPPPETTAPTQATAPTVAPVQLTHTVVAGETLADIAKMYGTTVDAIAALNPIEDVNLIVVGTQLKIPSSASTQPTETTSATVRNPIKE